MRILFAMRRFSVVVMTVMILFTGFARSGRAVPAFPGAEGFGSQTPGGRGGRVIEVTNLDDDGPGSLKAAVDAKGPRIVVFRVSGTIQLSRQLNIREPFITIAGQTAPGDGICLRGTYIWVGTHDVVIRYLRVRVGDNPDGPDPGNRDGIDVVGKADQVYNVVIDHCSFSWALDETVSTWSAARDVTVQWCIVSEPLMDSIHPQGSHSTGVLLGSEENTVSVHHCLLAHNSGRNPLIAADHGKSVIDWRNNVVYNYGGSVCGNARGQVDINYVGNYIKAGPNSREPGAFRIRPDDKQLYFVRDNIWPGQPESGGKDLMVLSAGRTPLPDNIASSELIAVPPVTVQLAADVYETVLNFSGTILPVRDVVDARIVEEVRTGAGAIIDTQWDVGGWPEYHSIEAPADIDHDGMPDDWEQKYGFSPDDPADGPKDRDGDGYTNVEEYLNATNPAEKATGASIPEMKPALQKGNERLRFGAARVSLDQETYEPADRKDFVDAVKKSEKEVADYLGLKFVQLPAGEFVKGFSRANITVTLTKPFEMSACEVTQGQWTEVMGTKPWLDRDYAQDAPENAVTYVSWDDCQEFVSRLNACGERKYRLPTEAESDYASRAGFDGKAMSWLSNDNIDEYAWHKRNTVRADEKYAHPVGRKKANPWNLYDMAGNVLEWCYDRFDYSYWRTGETKVDPMGPELGSSAREFHVVRGGSFYYSAQQIRTEYDRSNDIDPSKAHRRGYHNFDVGFRLVRLMP